MKIIKSFGKFLLAGITASAIISIILCVYSLTPVHIENPEKNTDYIWEPNSRWVTMEEGIGGGKYDANGFIYKTETHSDIENKHGYQRGKGRGGIN